MASASPCRRRLQRWHRSLRPRQDGEGEHQQSQPYHLSRRPPRPAQTQSGHQTHDRHTECHGTSVWCRVCVPARAQEQPRDLRFRHRDLGVQDS